MTTSTMDLDELGALDPATISGVVATALGREVELADWRAERFPYRPGSPATGALMRVTGTTTDGAPWSVFLKLLQHVRHWAGLTKIPEPFRQRFVADFPWDVELVAWAPGFAARLPEGLRVPVLYRLADLGDDRLAVWMEDVRVLPDAWDPARFQQAARLLGGLAALGSTPEALAPSPVPPGFGLRMYAGQRLQGALRDLEDDAYWAHPLVAQAVDTELRADLRALAKRVPELLDRMDALPQALQHGDASPQNLLVPADDPSTLVAIDVAFQSPEAMGFDLGQLLIGLCHAGELPAADLPRVHATLAPAYTTGARAYGASSTEAEITEGYIASLAVRAAFTALPFERLEEAPTEELAGTFHERAALTRFIVDRARELG